MRGGFPNVVSVFRSDEMTTTTERAADVLTYASAGGTIIAGLSLSEWGVVLGLVLSLCFGAFASYIKYQHLILAREQAAKGAPVNPPPHDDI